MNLGIPPAMPTEGGALAELEAKVGKRWADHAATREPDWPLPDLKPIDIRRWGAPITADVQFPREQWVAYPAKRTIALTLANRLMDFDNLSDDQWMMVCHLVFYGGKVRVS